MRAIKRKGQVAGIIGTVLGFVLLVIGVLQIALPVLEDAQTSADINLSTTSTSILDSTEVIVVLAVLVGGAGLIFFAQR